MVEGKLNYRENLARRLRVLKTEIILDAGTGAGEMTQTLSSGLRCLVVSIDANKRVFHQVSEKVDGIRVAFLACDFGCLPFRENVFSGVICDLVISTSREWKPSLVYSEFRRVLKTGSSLFITDYYSEKLPRTKEALLAAETSRLGRAVLKARGIEIQKSVSPESSVKQLREAGFTTICMKGIKANEGQEWKRRVFEEYFNGMQKAISDLKDLELRTRFAKKLKKLKDEIESRGRIRWAWSVNYLIEATK